VSIDSDYLRLVDMLAAALPPAEVTGLYLPSLVDDGEYRDELGFVFLADGSVGPFYVSLDPILRTLWARHPWPDEVRGDPIALARGLRDGDLAGRALAIGAFNALSRRLMRCAGFEPPDRGAGQEVPVSQPDGPVGMVGYFCPVIDRLVDAGNEVLVLEQRPQRVPERPHVRLTTRPEDLTGCGQVLCTASVLINDSLDALLAACRGAQFEVTGPTGSGLPDGLLTRGVQAVGGIVFDDPDRVREVLARGESWGIAGRKYRIRRQDYPGVETLVARCER
jgi:uncharacterized protein (DUF4213/DUF364 family)